MAHQTVRTNLAAAQFPLATPLWGRSIIFPQQDMNYSRDIVSSADTDKDKGIPQIFYAHNAMPTPQGWQSIGYSLAAVGIEGATDFDSAFTVETPDFARVIFVPAVGKNYIYDKTEGGWRSVNPLPNGAVRSDVLVTSAFVQGQTYIFYEGYGCFVYNTTTKTLDAVTLIGLDPTLILGIVGVGSYLIAFNATDISWSSLTNPLDFVPDLTTGAGGGAVTDAEGGITFIAQIGGGAIIYCGLNAVAAKLTGNINFPFQLVELHGAGGVEGPEQISWQANIINHFIWSNSTGLQKVDKSEAVNVYPEITDFLAGFLFEDFNELTKTFTVENLASQVSVKLVVVNNRFLIVSYGKTFGEYTHAVVVDLTLKRWGKLKIPHRDCFEWNFPNTYGILAYEDLPASYEALGPFTTYGDLATFIDEPQVLKRDIAFLQQDGTIKIVTFNLGEENANGVLVIGKFQFIRNKRISHQWSDVETVGPDNNFEMWLYTSWNGKDLRPAQRAFLMLEGEGMRRYGKETEDCVNFSTLFLGAFNLNSYLFDFIVGANVL